VYTPPDINIILTSLGWVAENGCPVKYGQISTTFKFVGLRQFPTDYDCLGLTDSISALSHNGGNRREMVFRTGSR